jgi:hypothetical protein
MDPQPPSITRAEYARRRGVSAPTVTNWVKRGRLPTLPDGNIDPIAADAAMDAIGAKSRVGRPHGMLHINPTTAAPGGTNVPPYGISKATREAALAQLAVLDLRQRKGELVLAADVTKESARAARAVRDAVLAVPARVAALVVVATERDAEQIIRDALREALTRVSQGLAE